MLSQEDNLTSFISKPGVKNIFPEIAGFPYGVDGIVCTRLQVAVLNGGDAGLYRGHLGYTTLTVQVVCDAACTLRMLSVGGLAAHTTAAPSTTLILRPSWSDNSQTNVTF